MVEYGYSVYIWQPIYWNGNFHHNVIRTETVHGRTESEAVAKVVLKPEEKPYQVHENFVVHVEAEYIHSVSKLGRVEWEWVPKYIKED